MLSLSMGHVCSHQPLTMWRSEAEGVSTEQEFWTKRGAVQGNQSWACRLGGMHPHGAVALSVSEGLVVL